MIGDGFIVTALLDETDSDEEEETVSSWHEIHSEVNEDEVFSSCNSLPEILEEKRFLPIN